MVWKYLTNKFFVNCNDDDDDDDECERKRESVEPEKKKTTTWKRMVNGSAPDLSTDVGYELNWNRPMLVFDWMPWLLMPDILGWLSNFKTTIFLVNSKHTLLSSSRWCIRWSWLVSWTELTFSPYQKYTNLNWCHVLEAKNYELKIAYRMNDEKWKLLLNFWCSHAWLVFWNDDTFKLMLKPMLLLLLRRLMIPMMLLMLMAWIELKFCFLHTIHILIHLNGEDFFSKIC